MRIGLLVCCVEEVGQGNVLRNGMLDFDMTAHDRVIMEGDYFIHRRNVFKDNEAKTTALVVLMVINDGCTLDLTKSFEIMDQIIYMEQLPRSYWKLFDSAIRPQTLYYCSVLLHRHLHFMPQSISHLIEVEVPHPWKAPNEHLPEKISNDTNDRTLLLSMIWFRVFNTDMQTEGL